MTQSKVKLVWATPDIDANLAYIARVSNPANQANESIQGLLRYMMREGHVSPFDMANFTVEINTTRDIGRQFLRHWSIKPQEFSQRYQSVETLGAVELREFRLQDPKNRQASISVPEDHELALEWAERQRAVLECVNEHYEWCLSVGGAKEVARVVLPEGLTNSRLYFNGTIRSWVHYLQSRLHISTQKEHRLIAAEVLEVFRTVAPIVAETFFPAEVV